MNSFEIEKSTSLPDGIGGTVQAWLPHATVKGYLDMMGGSDINSKQNAITEDSTHILIIPKYVEGITDDMRVVDSTGRYYTITYADNPVGQNHHNELYLKFGGEV